MEHAHRETTQDDANAITYRCGSPRYYYANTCSPPCLRSCRDLDDIFPFCPNTMRLRYNCVYGTIEDDFRDFRSFRILTVLKKKKSNLLSFYSTHPTSDIEQNRLRPMCTTRTTAEYTNEQNNNALKRVKKKYKTNHYIICNVQGVLRFATTFPNQLCSPIRMLNTDLD